MIARLRARLGGALLAGAALGVTATVSAATALLLLPLADARAAPHRPLADDAALDRETAALLATLARGDIERATVLARQLARSYPRFALAQLLHAELASLAAGEGTLAGSAAPWSPELLELLLEARLRLDPDTTTSPPAGDAPPPPLLQVGHDVEALVVVDLARSRLSAWTAHRGRTARLGEHYVSSGAGGAGKEREGDLRTPLGVYRVTGFRSDASLPELYGAGALMLDYPNAHDRLLGRTGSGIWLHGVPHARRSRAPLSSEGCVTMSNQHLAALRGRVDPDRTLIVLALPDPAAARSASERGAALETYRTLFAGYRDTRANGPTSAADPLSASERAALASLSPDAVTIVESPVDARSERVIMTFRAGGSDAAWMTLYWTRAPGASWTLALEDLTAAGT